MKGLFGRIWKALRLPRSWQLGIMRGLQDQFLVGVAGVIFNSRDEILLFRHTYRSFPWGLPGGYLHAREQPNEGLEREVLEESGLTVSADTRFKIRTDTQTARLEIIYIGTYIGGTFAPSKEVAEARFFPFDQLPRVRKTDLVLLEAVIKTRMSRQKNHPVR